MTTRLTKPMKREVELDGKLYTVALTPDAVKITPKGARTGQEISWRDLVSGSTGLRRDLNVSLDAYGGTGDGRARDPGDRHRRDLPEGTRSGRAPRLVSRQLGLDVQPCRSRSTAGSAG